MLTLAIAGTVAPAPTLILEWVAHLKLGGGNVNETVERKIVETPVEARQGMGPREMVSVLTVSLFTAAVAGSALLAYFVAG
jgi:hypothetical protein